MTSAGGIVRGGAVSTVWWAIPAISLGASVRGQIYLLEPLGVAGESVLLGGVLWMVATIVAGSPLRGGLLSAAVVLGLFLSGLAATILQISPEDADSTVHLLHLTSAGAGVALAWWVSRPETDLDRAWILTVSVGLGLLVPATVELAAGAFSQELAPSPFASRERSIEPVETLPQSRSLPDIYYIVPDRYASATVLQRFYGYSNEDFLSALRDRRFLISPTARANYQKTAHSLAASLNLDFVQELKLADRRSSGFLPLYDAIRDHRVGKLLQDAGYRYYHFGSWWQGSRSHSTADYDFMVADDPLPRCTPFRLRLLQNSVLSPFLRWLEWPSCVTDRGQPDRVHAKLSKLSELPADPEPTFALVHLLLLHEPYVFDSEGRVLSARQMERRRDRIGYVDQLRHLNRLLLTLVDSLTAASTEPPVIVIQADEGPPPPGWVDGGKPPNSPDTLLYKFGILSAVHLPEAAAVEIPSTLSPVNTFRLVFDAVLGTDLGLVPNRSWVLSPGNDLFDFVEVTRKLKEAQRQSHASDSTSVDRSRRRARPSG